MAEQICPGNFESEIFPHLKAAYNLARWLMLNSQDAEDVAQEACLRAFKYFASFRGGNGRSWLLKIVRNTCYTWLRENRPFQEMSEFDEELFPADSQPHDPEEIFLQSDSRLMVREAMEKLPSNFREVLVLRELEGMSYKEISEVTGMLPGTVMSRLSRARVGLRRSLNDLTSPLGRHPKVRANGCNFLDDLRQTGSDRLGPGQRKNRECLG